MGQQLLFYTCNMNKLFICGLLTFFYVVSAEINVQEGDAVEAGDAFLDGEEANTNIFANRDKRQALDGTEEVETRHFWHSSNCDRCRCYERACRRCRRCQYDFYDKPYRPS